MTKPRVTLIIPAHNEADSISSVLETVTSSELLDEIIVIADACTDNTADLARSFGVKVLEKTTTRGKGDAMIHGAQHAQGTILMFADADLKGFTTRHIQQVLEPVIKGKVTMSVGLRDRALGLGALIPKVAPTFAIGGERAMTRKFFDSLPKDQNLLDFGIETVMNYYAKMNRLRVAYPVLKNLKHTIKEKKWGWQDGVKQRMKLNRQVLRARKMMKQRAKSV